MNNGTLLHIITKTTFTNDTSFIVLSNHKQFSVGRYSRGVKIGQVTSLYTIYQLYAVVVLRVHTPLHFYVGLCNLRLLHRK